MASNYIYEPGKSDRCVIRTDLPRFEPNIAFPVVLASCHELILIYAPAEHEGRVGTCVVRFSGAACHYLGLPNDEVSDGHPLLSRGFEACSIQEVLNSSWVSSVCRLNAASGVHGPGTHADSRHLIFAFHDITFECLARSCSFTLRPESIKHVVRDVALVMAAQVE